MMVRLISHSDLGPLVCGYAAKVCTSAVMPECPDELAVTMRKGEELPFKKALDHALASGHDSVLEHWSATFAIEGISRACSHQLVRHRLASYCVSADTKIRTSSQKTNGKTIRELYHMKPQYFDMLRLRCVDDKGNLRYDKPVRILYAGIKPTFTVKTVHGYSIRTTKEHRFLTESGWKALEDIQIGEKVYINGQPSYKDKDWLFEMYHVRNLSQKEIGDMCGVSKNCIRDWVRRFGLQKEMGSWSIGVAPHNKGRTKEDYEPLKRTSEKMKGKHNPAMFRRGPEKIGSWKGDNITDSGLRNRTARAMYPRRTNVCALCGFHGVTEFHHMHGNLHNYDTDIIELCVACHKAIHRKEVSTRIVLSEVTSIEYYGEEETFDIEMPEPNHNYIADGFVVHNSQQSQRYVKMGGFDYIIPESIQTTKGTIQFRCEPYSQELDNDTLLEAYMHLMEDIQLVYSEFVKCGVPEEDARYILPNACCTNIVVTMNGRQLRKFFMLRCCNRAQWEIREMANLMLAEVKQVAPIIFENAGASCDVLGYCPEQRSCGKCQKLKTLLDKNTTT